MCWDTETLRKCEGSSERPRRIAKSPFRSRCIQRQCADGRQPASPVWRSVHSSGARHPDAAAAVFLKLLSEHSGRISEHNRIPSGENAMSQSRRTFLKTTSLLSIRLRSSRRSWHGLPWPHLPTAASPAGPGSSSSSSSTDRRQRPPAIPSFRSRTTTTPNTGQPSRSQPTASRRSTIRSACT